MDKNVKVRRVEIDCEDSLILTFSDGTTAAYVVEELLRLRPLRELAEENLESDRPITIVTKISFSMGGTRSN